VIILRYVKLPKENFEEFFNSLRKWGKLYAPTKKGNIYSFQHVENPPEIAFDYTRTMLPPKKFFVRPKDEMLRLRGGVNGRRAMEPNQ